MQKNDFIYLVQHALEQAFPDANIVVDLYTMRKCDKGNIKYHHQIVVFIDDDLVANETFVDYNTDSISIKCYISVLAQIFSTLVKCDDDEESGDKEPEQKSCGCSSVQYVPDFDGNPVSINIYVD